MGIRESLLNTITSVADSDFVRVVTSAGASSKATVANLFKSFETGLGAKSSLTTSDYIRVVGSDDVSYKQNMSSVMETMGLKYADLGSFSTQSALETALNTKLNAMLTNSTASLRIAVSATFGAFQSGVSYIGELRKGASSTYASISLHGLGINAEIVGNKASSTWAFQKEPTRAEVAKVQNIKITLSSLTWTHSGAGVYYVAAANGTAVPNANEVLGVSLTNDFSYLTGDFIMPTIDAGAKKICFIASNGTWNSSAYVNVRVIYR